MSDSAPTIVGPPGTDPVPAPLQGTVIDRGRHPPSSTPKSGRNLLPGRPWTYSNRPAPPLRPAPTVGQHSREVLRGELGLTDEEYDQLVVDGVTGTL